MGFKDTYLEIWVAAWNLHKKYYGTQAADEQNWKLFDQECEQLDKKYAGKPEQKFLQSLLLSVNSELERRKNG